MTPAKSPGYVDVGALKIYYERYGTGRPLVLLHGAFGTIESCFAELLPRLARHFQLIAVELQGHGHTRDIDRPGTACPASRNEPRRSIGSGRLAVLDDHRIPDAAIAAATARR